MNSFDTVDKFERELANYAGSKYAVAVNSCTNAILLSLSYLFFVYSPSCKKVILPSRTYVGVPYAVLAAGGICHFEDVNWKGAYTISIMGLDEKHIIDSARRFRRGMYRHNTLYTLSFHWGKHLPIGTGGAILTNSYDEYSALKRMRYDGRTENVNPIEDSFELPGYHCMMSPSDAAQGIMLLNYTNYYNEDLENDEYPYLPKYEIFTKGY